MKNFLWELLAWCGYGLMALILMFIMGYFLGNALESFLVFCLVAESFMWRDKIEALNERIKTLENAKEDVK